MHPASATPDFYDIAAAIEGADSEEVALRALDVGILKAANAAYDATNQDRRDFLAYLRLKVTDDAGEGDKTLAKIARARLLRPRYADYTVRPRWSRSEKSFSIANRTRRPPSAPGPQDPKNPKPRPGQQRPAKTDVHHPTKAHPEPNHRLSHLELEIDLTDIRFSAPPEKL
eukprot:jgi/Tetstr1/463141/TSEL_008075.t1